MKARTTMILATASVGLLAATAGRAILGSEHSSPAAVLERTRVPRPQLIDGQPSIDALLDQFREALATRDASLLRRLRVTEDEYRSLILPGSVDPGQPRGDYSEQASQYFWGILNGKSTYTEQNLLYSWGGKNLQIDKVEYRKGIRQYRDYTAYKQLTVSMKENGEEPEPIRIGSIAEVDGQFKFISYVRD